MILPFMILPILRLGPGMCFDCLCRDTCGWIRGVSRGLIFLNSSVIMLNLTALGGMPVPHSRRKQARCLFPIPVFLSTGSRSSIHSAGASGPPLFADFAGNTDHPTSSQLERTPPATRPVNDPALESMHLGLLALWQRADGSRREKMIPS